MKLDLSQVPDDELFAECAKRRALRRSYKITCECGECKKCKQRIYRKKRRAEGKD